jgi:hypothetical protein
MRDLSAPVAPGASGETLEACRIALLDSANKLAAMRRLTEAYHREIDRAVCGTPAAGKPSHAGTVRQRGAAIASMLGANRPVYAMPMEKLHTAQAAADELDRLEGDERRCMTERVQQLIDAAAAQQEAGRRVVEPGLQAGNLPPRREHGATSRTPTGGARDQKQQEPAASRSRTHVTIERDQDGHP